MKLVKGKRQYKLPPYRQVVQVAVIIKFPKHTWNASLTPSLPSAFASMNPGHIGTPVFYCVGENRELFVWPTPERSGKLKVTLAVERVV